jgi:hypothetical protein
VKQGATHRPTSNFAHLNTVPQCCPRAELTRQWSLLVLAGQCWLVWLSSLATFVEEAVDLSTKLRVGSSWLLPGLGSNSSPERVWNPGPYILPPHEDNGIQLLRTIRSRRWKNNFYGTLEGMSTHRIAVVHTIRIVDVRHVAVYTVPWCEASQGGRCCKNFLLPVVGLCWSACILLICPSKPTQSYFPSFLPVHLPFSISIFSVQSQGGCLFCLAVSYCMSLFSLSLSHLKALAIKNVYK